MFNWLKRAGTERSEEKTEQPMPMNKPVKHVIKKPPIISQPIKAIVDAMRDRPDTFVVLFDDEGGYGSYSVTDNVTSFSFSVRRCFSGDYSLGYSSIPTLGPDTIELYLAAAKIRSAEQYVTLAKICTMYGVSAPQTPDN